MSMIVRGAAVNREVKQIFAGKMITRLPVEGMTVLCHGDGSAANAVANTAAPVWHGTEAYSEGKFGQAFSLNGASCVKIPYCDDIVFGSGDFTIAGWFCVPAQTTNYPFLFSHAYYYSSTYKFSGISVFFAGANSRKLYMRFFTSATSYTEKISTVDIPINEWVHVAMVRNGETITLYINGRADISLSFGGVIYQPEASTFKIGASTNESAATDDPAWQLTGMVDEFIIAKAALWTESFTPPDAPYVTQQVTKPVNRGIKGVWRQDGLVWRQVFGGFDGKLIENGEIRVPMAFMMSGSSGSGWNGSYTETGSAVEVHHKECGGSMLITKDPINLSNASRIAAMISSYINNTRTSMSAFITLYSAIPDDIANVTYYSYYHYFYKGYGPKTLGVASTDGFYPNGIAMPAELSLDVSGLSGEYYIALETANNHNGSGDGSISYSDFWIE